MEYVGSGQYYGNMAYPAASADGKVVYAATTNLMLGAPGQTPVRVAGNVNSFVWGPSNTAVFSVTAGSKWPVYSLQGTNVSLLFDDGYAYAYSEGGRVVARDQSARLYSGNLSGLTLLSNAFYSSTLWLNRSNVLVAGTGEVLWRHDTVGGWQKIAYAPHLTTAGSPVKATNLVAAFPGFYVGTWPEARGVADDGTVLHYTGLMHTNPAVFNGILYGLFTGKNPAEIQPVVFYDNSYATNGLRVPGQPGMYFKNPARQLLTADGTVIAEMNGWGVPNYNAVPLGICLGRTTNDFRVVMPAKNVPGLGVTNAINFIENLFMVGATQYVVVANMIYHDGVSLKSAYTLWQGDTAGTVRLLMKAGDKFIDGGRTNTFAQAGSIFVNNGNNGASSGADGQPCASHGWPWFALTDNTNTWRVDLSQPPNRPPLIAGQPPSVTNFTRGGTATLTVSVSAAPPAYHQWYFQTNYTSNSVFYSFIVPVAGATSTNLVLPNLQAGNQGSYFLTVSNSYGVATSLWSYVYVDTAPFISVPPLSQVVVTGQTLTLSVTAQANFGNNSSFSSQWYRDGTPLAGATQTTYTRNNFLPADTGSYWVVLSNAVGVTTSQVAVITFTNGFAPVFTLQPPANVTLVRGGKLTLSCNATGTTAITYRWYLSNTVVATTATYTRNNAQANAAGSYYVVASNRVAAVTSAVCQVSIITGSNAVFRGVPFTRVLDRSTPVPDPNTSSLFTNVGALRIRNGQIIAAASYVTDKAATRSNLTSVFSLGSQGIRKIYDGTLAPAGISNKLTGLSLGKPGSGTYLAQGTYVTNAADIVPANQTVFSFDEAGNRTLIADYYQQTPPQLPGSRFELMGMPEYANNRAAFLAFYGVTTNYPGLFTWTAGGGLVGLTAPDVLLPGYNLPLRQTSTQLSFDGTNIAFWGGYALPTIQEDGIYRLPAAGGALTRVADRTSLIPGTGLPFQSFLTPPALFGSRTYFMGYDDFFGAHAANGTEYVAYGDESGLHKVVYTGEAAPWRPVPASFTHVFPRQAISSGVYLQASLSDGGSAIVLWQDGGLEKVIDNLDLLDSLPISSASFLDADDTTVLLAVNFVNGTTAYYANLTNQPPVITTQPTGVTVGEGGTTGFSVTAYGPGPLSYLWYVNGSPRLDETNAYLGLGYLQLADSGSSVQVEVRNATGLTTSQAATLYVIPYPSFTVLPSDTVALAGSTVNWSITVANALTNSLYWYHVNPTNGSLTYKGVGPGLTLSNVQPANAGSYYVQAMNYLLGGATYSNSPTFNLVVVTNAAQLTGAPIITRPPVGFTNSLGFSNRLAVAVYNNSGTATYQWLKDDAQIPGATGASLVFPSLQAADSAAYAVIISNPAGSTTSLVTRVLAILPPVVVPQTVAVQASPGAVVTLSAPVGGTPPFTTAWYKNGTYYTSTSGTNAQLAMSVQAASTGTYTFQVSNASGSVTGGVFHLTVAAALLKPQATGNNAQSIRANGFSLSLTLDPTAAFTVESSSNLVNWAAVTNLPAGSSSVNLQDWSATNKSSLFYRAVKN
jgi:hypothetical protein